MFKSFNVFVQSLDGLLHETPGDAPSGGAPTPAPSAAAPTPAAPTAAPAAATPPAATPPPATPGGGDGLVPSYRLREIREAEQRRYSEALASERAQWEAKYNQIQSQLHALVGVRPPENPEVDAVRQQFASLFPRLAALEEKGEDVLGLLERAGDYEAQTEHHWQTYGRQTMDRLFEHAQSSMGGPLTEEAKRMLHTAFTGFVSSSPEMTARYAQDPSIVEDFWKGFTSGFIDPVRRTAAAGVAARVPGAIPQDTPGGAPRATPAPAPQNQDERAAMAWTRYNQLAKP